MKIVAQNFYVHKTNILELESVLTPDQVSYLHSCMKYLGDKNYCFQIIKFNRKEDSFSFINVFGWDTLYEPISGTSYKFKKGCSFKKIGGGNTVYHHKWMFVAPTYEGFNIQESKERSEAYKAIPEFKENLSRVGSRSYWEDFLKRYNLPIGMKGE